MAHTRWRSLISRFAREAHRELLITLTRPASPAKWAFIVGCYNSGTTLLSEVLGRHPQIADLPDEGQYLTDQLLLDYQIGLPRMWVLREDLFRMDETSSGPDVVRMRKEWGLRLRKPGASIVLEKTPANMARTRWLQANFDNAHFIGVIRSPYAVAAGIRKKAEPKHQPQGWHIAQCARQWARSNRVLEEDAQKLSRFIWMRYEDLVAQPEASIAAAYALLGVTAPAPVAGERSWSIHERNEPIRDMNAESTKDLSAEDVEIINHEIGGCIEHFGYTRVMPACAARQPG